MIPVGWDKIPTSPAWEDFILGLHREIKLHPGKEGQFSNLHLFKFVYILI